MDADVSAFADVAAAARADAPACTVLAATLIDEFVRALADPSWAPVSPIEATARLVFAEAVRRAPTDDVVRRAVAGVSTHLAVNVGMDGLCIRRRCCYNIFGAKCNQR